MAYYGYYQNAVPHWGQQAYANQFAHSQFIAPPMPQYTPQPSWGGQDYYAAHYRNANNGMMDNSDVGMFDYVWSRLKGFVGAAAVGSEEARHWHRRVYGGMVDITSLLPSDLGAAAGYEAFRLFNYHRTIYRSPLMDDREREEEALAGLAIAEATKLWSYCQRPSDKYGRRETCEVAASTAERLLRRTRRRDSGSSREYSRYGSSASSYGSSYGDYDNSSSDPDEDYRRSSRHRRRRSSSSYGTMIPGGLGNSGYLGAGGSGMPIPSYASRVGYPAIAASPHQPMYTAQPSYTAAPATYGGTYQYGANQYGAGMPGGGLVIPQRSRASSFSYSTPYQQY